MRNRVTEQRKRKQIAETVRVKEKENKENKEMVMSGVCKKDRARTMKNILQTILQEKTATNYLFAAR